MHASRREKGQLLDEFCALTGYTRKHALVLLSHPPAEPPVSLRRGRKPGYGAAEGGAAARVLGGHGRHLRQPGWRMHFENACDSCTAIILAEAGECFENRLIKSQTPAAFAAVRRGSPESAQSQNQNI